jgi:hypothetical protein
MPQKRNAQRMDTSGTRTLSEPPPWPNIDGGKSGPDYLRGPGEVPQGQLEAGHYSAEAKQEHREARIEKSTLRELLKKLQAELWTAVRL